MQGGFPPRLSTRAKFLIGAALALGLLVFVLAVRSILSPFLWALVVAYVLGPVVNYLTVRGRLPRVWSVALIFALAVIGLVTMSRYLYPRVVEDGTVFIEDIPRLEASLIALVGPRPLGINIDTVVHQILAYGTGSSGNAGHLIVNAVETIVRVFLFLVATFYLLMDGPHLRSSLINYLPDDHRDDLIRLGRQINLTWQQYIRGELVLFAIMATVTTVGLTILGVPGAIFLGLASGALELLPLVGPWSAGALAVAVAYLSGSNPFGWSQLAYAGAVALMYFILRQAEDYIVIPKVIGRAVRLHPLVVLLAVASGGVIGGLLGLLIAVPAAASLKEVVKFLNVRLRDREYVPDLLVPLSLKEVPRRDSRSESEVSGPERPRPV